MTKGFKRLTAGLLSAAVIFAQAAIPVFAEEAAVDDVLLDIDFDQYESIDELPVESGFKSSYADTEISFATDKDYGKVLKISRKASDNISGLTIFQQINKTIDPSKDYVYSYRFKAEGSGWYGDFMALTGGGSGSAVVNSGIYGSALQIKESPNITHNVSNGNVGAGKWITVNITLHPKAGKYDAEIITDGQTEKETLEDKELFLSNFNKIDSLKSKINAGKREKIDMYIDYISIKEVVKDAPETTPTPETTPIPGALYEWNFNDCTTEADIPEGWQYNQDEYTTSLIDDGNGGKAVKYQKSSSANTQFLQQNTFGKISVDKSSDDLYEYGFKFKTDGTCFYGDFGKLLASNAVEIASLGLYLGGLQVAGTQITGDVGKQDGWMTLRVVINPKKSSLDAYVDYEIDSKPVHNELKNVTIKDAFSDISIIKFKRNGTADAVGFALDDIYIRKIEAEPNLETETTVDKTEDLSGSGGGKAMSFITTISNSGTAAGEVKSILWNVTSGSESKSSDKFDLPNISIAPGAGASIVLIVDGLYDDKATATAVIE